MSSPQDGTAPVGDGPVDDAPAVDAPAVDSEVASLREALAEAEAILGAIAHELRSPVGSLQILGTLLGREHGAALEERGRALLARLNACTQDTNAILDRLALFASIRTRTLTPVAFDLRTEVTAAFDAEVRRHGGATPALELSDLPGIVVDPALMRLVLGNLLANAIRCTSRRPAARIEVSGGLGAAEATFCVRDNGIGFDAQQARRLFLPFGRVHSQADYPGDGIGLALVRSIVRRHGGRVWAEGVPGEGATFHVALPRAASQPASVAPAAE